MANARKFSKETTIYVKVPSNLTLEQTNAVTAGLMQAVGHPHCYSGFKIQFINESELIGASFDKNNVLTVS